MISVNGNMAENMKLYYHVFVMLTFLSGFLWQIAHMKYETPDHPFVADIFEYTGRFFTCWNVIFHFIYFSLALSEDIEDAKAQKTRSFSTRQSIIRLKAYLFSTMLIPSTALVCGVFWIFFFFDRNWVFPKCAEVFAMKFTNHVVHTFVGIFALMEYFFNRHHPEVDFKSCFIGITGIYVAYCSVFFHHYFTVGRYLYPVFEGLTVIQAWGVLFPVYLWALLGAKVGVEIDKYTRNFKTEKNQPTRM